MGPDRSLFDSLADAILVADPDGRCLDANTRATTLRGYTRHELMLVRHRGLSPA